MTVRFQDLLRDRVEWLNKAFNDAIAEKNKYSGSYYGVFPIKVNQLREVVEEITAAGLPFHYGLEAGSKPELYSALATHRDPDSLIICNGYKDTAFIRTATIGRKLDKKIILIAEKLEEIKSILEISREMGVDPWIGVRVRLAAKSTGIWATSGGESAKFGLSTLDLMEAVEYLREQGALDALRMVHFHIGSQIPDIQSIKKATREATRYYAKLKNIGFDKLDFIDIGGGLGVDYDGSRTLFHSSTNYTLDEYVGDCIFNIKDVCDEEGVPHPNVVSESGRAIVAHHSVLIVQVFGTIEKTKAEYDLSVRDNDHKWIKQLAEVKGSTFEPIRAKRYTTHSKSRKSRTMHSTLEFSICAQKRRSRRSIGRLPKRYRITIPTAPNPRRKTSRCRKKLKNLFLSWRISIYAIFPSFKACSIIGLWARFFRSCRSTG